MIGKGRAEPAEIKKEGRPGKMSRIGQKLKFNLQFKSSPGHGKIVRTEL